LVDGLLTQICPILTYSEQEPLFFLKLLTNINEYSNQLRNYELVYLYVNFLTYLHSVSNIFFYFIALAFGIVYLIIQLLHAKMPAVRSQLSECSLLPAFLFLHFSCWPYFLTIL